ncbi:hypothetical protein NIES4101_40700 [Calothrix sp. NIES-4101]|nr:hypothetical protein NIES4101_40700 [Calothrix sp. NIES-4101]
MLTILLTIKLILNFCQHLTQREKLINLSNADNFSSYTLNILDLLRSLLLSTWLKLKPIKKGALHYSQGFIFN